VKNNERLKRVSARHRQTKEPKLRGAGEEADKEGRGGVKIEEVWVGGEVSRLGRQEVKGKLK